MGVKRKFSALILTSVILMSAVLLYMQQKPYSTVLVMESLFDKYEVQSLNVGDTDQVISIDVYDKKDIPEVEKYLKSKLSKDDLEHFEINVFSLWS